jgi:hypothetical protein
MKKVVRLVGYRRGGFVRIVRNFSLGEIIVGN